MRDLQEDARRLEAQKALARASKPIRSDVRNGNFSDRYWCATLDGRPVEHCRAFDTQAGWVEVFVVSERHGERSVRSTSAVRLYGRVEAIWLDDWEAMRKERPGIEVFRAPTCCMGDL
jgi:hypothetical protein